MTAYLGWDTHCSRGARASPDVVGQFPYFGRPCFHQLWRVKKPKQTPMDMRRDGGILSCSSTAPTQHGQGCDRSPSWALPWGMFPNLRQAGATLSKPPCSPFWLGPLTTGIFVTEGMITYQQYFSGFFKLPFPEIPGFKRKAASANPALAAAMPALRILSLLGAFCTWPFLYKVAQEASLGPKLLST